MTSPPASAAAPPRREARRGAVAFGSTAVALAGLVAAVAMAPHLRFAHEVGAADGGIAFGAAKDAEFYVAQVRHVADGTYGHPNDLLFEWSGGEAAGAPWTYRLLAALHAASGGDLHSLVTASIGVCSALQCLLFAAILRTARVGRALSLAGAAAACLAPFLFSYVGWELWLGRPERVTTGFLPLLRPVNPSLSSVFVWAAVLAVLRWVREPGRARLATATLAVAVLWTAYPAAFVFAAGFTGCAAVLLLAARRVRPALALGAAAAVAALVNLPWILRTVSHLGAGPADTLESNLLALPSRAPILSASTAACCVVAATCAALRIRRRFDAVRTIAAAAGAGALLLAFNQQVVTGRVDQPFHYDWFYAGPVAWISVALLASELRGRGRATARLLARPRVRTAVRIVAAAAPIAVAALVAAGGPGAAVLRAVGLVRAAHVERPVLLVASVAAVSALAWGALALVARHRWRILAACVGIAAVGLAVAEGWRQQMAPYLRFRETQIALQPLGGALRHVRDRGTTDDVVLASDDLAARLVPSYTGRNVLISVEAQFAPVPPDDEFRDRRLTSFALLGLPADALAAGLGDGGRFHSAVFKWRTFGPPPPSLAAVSSGLHAATLPPDAAERVMATYRSMLAEEPAALLRRYRVDWILWRDTAEPFRDPGPALGLVPAWQAPGVRLYRVPGAR